MRAQLAMHRARVRDLVAESIRGVLGEEHNGLDADSMAVALLALSNGLAIGRFIDPDAIPDALLGFILTVLQGPSDPDKIV